MVQYYLLASDVFRLDRLHWVMETSLLKTLAGKHRSTVSAMARKHKATIDTPVGPRKCMKCGPPRVLKSHHLQEGERALAGMATGIRKRRRAAVALRVTRWTAVTVTPRSRASLKVLEI
ncbi:group II intron reverse transcriptase/maturase [Streptosporangium sp. G11]|uniref:group II intron reverse transcriptase/maturase n=1 Tax=Streptosporangium sp. G11 TaxID=3436926 RepID=UPI003EBF91A0